MKKLKKTLSKKNILILIVIALFITCSPTLAKYVIQEFHSYFLNAKNFYFTSNRLKTSNPTYLINNWSGVGSFSISFNLSSEKNGLVHTPYDIPYEVSFTCPNDVSCQLDKVAGTIYEQSNTHSDTVTLSVNPNRSYQENETLQIYVEASSISPYTETIGAYFEYVVGKQGITYEIEDEENRPYLLFKITSAINYCEVITAFGDYQVGDLIESNAYRQLSAENKEKCQGENINLTFNPSIIILDTTSNIINEATIGNTLINNISYVSSLNFYIDPLSTTAIKFYKNDPTEDYTYPDGENTSIIGVTYSS